MTDAVTPWSSPPGSGKPPQQGVEVSETMVVTMPTESLDGSHLLPHELDIRHKFVQEFVKDYQPVDAAIRCGYKPQFAQVFGPQLMGEAVVLHLVQVHEDKFGGKPDDQELNRRRIIQALYREASYGHSGASRVSALGHLKSIYGLDAPVKQEIEHKGSGVMVYMPDNGRGKPPEKE